MAWFKPNGSSNPSTLFDHIFTNVSTENIGTVTEQATDITFFAPMEWWTFLLFIHSNILSMFFNICELVIGLTDQEKGQIPWIGKVSNKGYCPFSVSRDFAFFLLLDTEQNRYRQGAANYLLDVQI